MLFRDREDAAERMADQLDGLRGQRPLILAIPRGAVPMGRVLAERLDGDLDLVLVRKLGAPGNPELAIGSVDEDGEIALNDVAHALRVPESYVQAEARRELALLRDRRRRLSGHPHADPEGRVVVIVDDGLATGSTMLAAIHALRRRHPRRIIACAPVGGDEAIEAVRRVADEVVCLDVPGGFRAVGEFYDDFSPVSDAEVVETLRRFRAGRGGREVSIRANGVVLQGDLETPPGARALVVFAHGSGSSRKSPRNRFVAETLRRRGIATLLLDLLTAEEESVEETARRRFDVELLATRLLAATRWAGSEPGLAELPIGYFGASTGAACALEAAAAMGDRVGAIVSRGGRPDLAPEALPCVRAPTLFLVGGDDQPVLALNRMALDRLASPLKRLEVVPGATHLFEEPGALERVAESAARWFETHLASAAHAPR